MEKPTDLLNALIIVIRFFTLIPLALFIINQFHHYGKDNGMIWRVRRLMLVLASGAFIGIANLLYDRYQISVGHNPSGLDLQIGLVITSGIMAGCIWWAFIEILNINRD